MNYKGFKSYKTRLGTFFTFGLATFILIFGLFSLIEIFEFKNPQITQFTLYDKRQSAAKFNFAETYGSIAFGFQNPQSLEFVKVDP